MSEERQDPKQVAAFRALARRLTEARSAEKFEEALRKLMSPSADEQPQPLAAKAAKPRSDKGS